MNKVFVTGADGMLGSSICRELLNQNYKVKAMCLPHSEAATLVGLPIEIVKGDILDKDYLLKAMIDCDLVINVAALTHVWPRRNEKVNEVNYVGAKNIMEVVETLKLKRMVHIGSASSFKHGSKTNPGDENCDFDGWNYKMDYIESKYLAQKMLLDKFKDSGFPVIIINPTFMIGPFDSGPSSGEMLIKFYNNCIPGYSGGGKNFVCSKDVATAAVNALKKGKNGNCYIAGNENLEYKEFLLKASKIMGKDFELKKIPQPLILFVGIVNSCIARITNKKPKLSYGIAKLAIISQYFSAKRAVTELDMPQTPIEEGIKQCVNWFQNNGYIK
jgi:dihydroflavonol-4-reductase